MNWIKFFVGSTATINLFVILVMNITQLGSKAVLLSSIILLSMTIPMILYLVSSKWKVYSINLTLISFFLIIFEVLFFFRIVEHPSIITWKITNKSIHVVEFLEENPFVKFKPNSIVKSQGSRGKDFTYEWLTDDYGFKNKKNLVSNYKINYIALGDSFTEAMGVSTDNTWTNKISEKSSIKVYNAGIQGYSASQMKGAYLYLINKIPHKGIIIGALPTIYKREKTFSNMALAVKQMGTGGIRSIAQTTNKYKENSFLVGFIRAIKNIIIDRKRLNINDENGIGVSSVARYQNEIPKSIIDMSSLDVDDDWNAYTQNLKELSSIALKNNKEVILIQFPHRHEIYFSASDQGLKNIFETQYYHELNLLRKELPEEVIVLDMYPFLKSHWDKNKQPIYFSIDGHMNELGNELIADFLLIYLKT